MNTVFSQLSITLAQSSTMSPESLMNSFILVNQTNEKLCVVHLGLALGDSILSYVLSIFPRQMIKAL